MKSKHSIILLLSVFMSIGCPGDDDDGGTNGTDVAGDVVTSDAAADTPFEGGTTDTSTSDSGTSDTAGRDTTASSDVATETGAEDGSDDGSVGDATIGDDAGGDDLADNDTAPGDDVASDLDDSDSAGLDAGDDADVSQPDDTSDDVDLGPDLTCRETVDCADTDFSDRCLAPGEHIGCGAPPQMVPSCQEDVECEGEGMICRLALPEDCVANDGKICRFGCIDPEHCDEGEVCTENRCQAATCSLEDPCPAQFDCDTTCERRSCEEDETCDEGGFCVKGFCYDTPGMCTPLPG